MNFVRCIHWHPIRSEISLSLITGRISATSSENLVFEPQFLYFSFLHPISKLECEKFQQKQNDTLKMASVSVSMTLPLNSAKPSSSRASLKKPSLPFPEPKRSVVKKSQAKGKVGIEASLKEKTVTGLTAAALASYMVIPEMAYAAGNDFSPSLKNFLLSIFAGGVVLAAIFGAVIGVANFDPVKRA
ncbi:hypothetical protein VNO77_32365 [Canavalia gladiata]|uniref:Ultraviolet-B-repressible protein n=1 Tax=Canavalia gladiata TaxID=3824 RepID=A0AAN9Q462_CANGL